MPETSIIRVEQGPRWLVEFFMHPPWWFQPTMVGLALTVAGLAGYRLHQRGWRITPRQQWEMLEASGLIVAIMTGVLAMANYTASPYLLDVTAGFLAGYGATWSLKRTRDAWPAWVSGVGLSAAWGALALCAFLLPLLAALNGKGTLLGVPRYYLVALGIGMAAYNELALKELLANDPR